MNPDMEKFLNLKTQPERLTAEEAAWMLGFSAHEIPILIAQGLLKPLGHPAHNGPTQCLGAMLKDLERDEKWHGKAADAVMEYWRHKNSRKLNQSGNQPQSRLQTQVADSGD